MSPSPRRPPRPPAARTRFDCLLEAAPGALLVLDEGGVILEANARAMDLLGADRLAGQRLDERIPAGLEQEGGRALFARRDDGSEIPVELQLRRFVTSEGPFAVAAVRDLAEGEREREAAARLAAVLGSLSDAIASTSLEGRITSWNLAAEAMFGYTAKEALGKDIAMLRDPADIGEPEEAAILARIRRGEPVKNREVRRVRKDGTSLWVSASVSPLQDGRGRIVGATGAMRDVTERRAAEARIEASLREKEVMLQEIHHRVKNNLQVVASLLNLQGQHAGDARTRELFQDSRNRIRSIALVHEKLYRSKDLSRLDFHDYLEDLVKELRRFYPKSQSVAIVLDAQPLAVGVDAAINCGLVVSELVSNALKHAFPDGRPGVVRIALKDGSRPGRIEVTVADDGVGMAGPFDPAAAPTLGMQLVATIVRQLDGTIERLPGPGTTLRMDLAVEAKVAA
ncbi:MAG: hypothetical protein QOD77_241 [Thermoplasmata archaeon]|jgi:PAS domain S-box-containing protein|nr:hypothetical protein [Thermoplasmata archaeon]